MALTLPSGIYSSLNIAAIIFVNLLRKGAYFLSKSLDVLCCNSPSSLFC